MRKKKGLILIISIVALLAFAIIGCGNDVKTKIGYVGDTNGEYVLLFDIVSRTPFYIPTSELENVTLGDKISFNYKKTAAYNNFDSYSSISINEIVKTEDKVWPATNDLNYNYTYYEAINSNCIVMENEYIVAGSDSITAFESDVESGTPCYIRVVDFGDGTSCCITDVFYNGKTFFVMEDSTRNTFNTTQEVTLTSGEYSYLEKYNFSGIDLTYLTNTQGIAEMAMDSGLFNEVYSDGYEGEPIDMFWLYYDVTEFEHRQYTVEDENNTLTFEDGILPVPNILIDYKHYVSETITVVTQNEIVNEDGSTETVNDTVVNNTGNIVLKDDTLEVEPREVHIEQGDKEYNLHGTDTLTLDLSSYVVITNETSTIDLTIDDAYEYESCTLKCYSYSDLDNPDATPLEEFELSSNPYTLELPDVGIYIYEINIIGENYTTRYVFFLDRES